MALANKIFNSCSYLGCFANLIKTYMGEYPRKQMKCMLHIKTTRYLQLTKPYKLVWHASKEGGN